MGIYSQKPDNEVFGQVVEKFCFDFLFDRVECALYTLTIYNNVMTIFKVSMGRR